MGFLDRLIDGVNRVAEPVQNVLTPTDPRLSRGARLERDGARAEGVIVGIARSVKGEAIHTVFAVEVAATPTTSAVRFGTEVTSTPHLHRLRLGLAVPVRVDGDSGVIDWPILAATWGLTDGEPGQRPQRTAPADGLREGALTGPVLRALERGRRTMATIVALDRVTVLGMPTINWDVTLRLEDGTTLTCPEDKVPPYAWWSAFPGAEVPVGIDPKDPTRAAVEWPAVALIARTEPVGIHDVPPAGSIAEEVMRPPAPAPAASSMGAVDTTEVIAAHRDEAQVVGTLRDWVGEVEAGRMKPKAFLKYVAEWEAAGMCTAEEASTARRAAGL